MSERFDSFLAPLRYVPSSRAGSCVFGGYPLLPFLSLLLVLSFLCACSCRSAVLFFSVCFLLSFGLLPFCSFLCALLSFFPLFFCLALLSSSLSAPFASLPAPALFSPVPLLSAFLHLLPFSLSFPRRPPLARSLYLPFVVLRSASVCCPSLSHLALLPSFLLPLLLPFSILLTLTLPLSPFLLSLLPPFFPLSPPSLRTLCLGVFVAILIDDLNLGIIINRQPIFTKNRIEILVFKFTLIVDTRFA